ncbi:type II toxin-antitoxin system VapC family toxin [Allomesorhizobium camelthorni]|uniref:PIN domain nuclease n=1 Tax=Allomesorhizobium camelthorni TaxID=475069 RepID=A0A6G4W6H4_9HYPH|nr:PIN domain nuclease [Mesorhizobium camelthorni]NGO49928.1 PIN domain nuclease [Mesorhizobium camelthorni]
MIVDSSVLIAELRGQDSGSVRAFRAAVVQQRVLLGDLILLEVLQGARDERHANLLKSQLGQFPTVEMLNRNVAFETARNFRVLRGHGVTVRKTIDLIIATYCILHGHALLHQDRDFTPMTKHLGLRLV